MKKASMVVGDRVWTLTYTNNIDGSITIQNFDNEDSDGYMFFEQLERLNSVNEDGTDQRIVESVTINGNVMDVKNKQNVYSYKQPL
jgi:hypothetical protein